MCVLVVELWIEKSSVACFIAWSFVSGLEAVSCSRVACSLRSLHIIAIQNVDRKDFK